MQDDAPVETESGAGHGVKKGAVHGPEQGLSGEELFRGVGVAAVKSVELFWLSVQPAFFLKTANVLDPAGAKLDPSKQLAVEPNPMKSTTPVVGHATAGSTVVLFTRATLPAVADILVVPEASKAGSAAPTAPPEANRTR